jgi:hypothetical protein
MDTEALKPILAGLVRHGLTSIGGALVAGGYIQSSDTSAFIGGGMVVAGMLWSWWQKEGQAEVAALLKKVTATHTATQAVEVAKAMPAAATVAEQAKFAAISNSLLKILLVAFLLSAFLVPAAFAQGAAPTPKPRATFTGRPVADLKNAIDNLTAPTTPDEIAKTACDISMFSKLTFENAVPLIQKCVATEVAGQIAPLVPDTQAALDSAKASKDGTAIACLEPGLALLTAAAGTPATKATDGTITPAIPPGPILIFQKLREFVTAGGPSNCKTAVQSTINGLMSSAL